MKSQRVFVSYSHNDADSSFIRKLTKDLEKAGVDVWVDAKDIRIGDNWLTSIHEAILNSTHFILIASESTNKSKWVQREYDLAVRSGKTLIPILVTGGEKLLDELGLDKENIVDARQNYQEAINNLAKVVKQG